MLQPPITQKRDHILGNANAHVQLVQYGDLQCQLCAQLFPTVKRLAELMGDQLTVVFRHYPRPQVHTLALHAAICCELAGMQGRFWQMHDMIFKNQQVLSYDSLLGFAKIMRLDMTRFTNTDDYKKAARKVISDFESGVRSGVDTTPTLFINS